MIAGGRDHRRDVGHGDPGASPSNGRAGEPRRDGRRRRRDRRSRPPRLRRPDGRGGNPLGVFLDGAAIPRDDARPWPHELATRRRSSSTTRGGRDPDLHAGTRAAVRRPSDGWNGVAPPRVRRRRSRCSGRRPATCRSAMTRSGPGSGRGPMGPPVPRSTSCDSAATSRRSPVQAWATPGRYVWAWIDEAAGERSARGTSRRTSGSSRTRRRGCRGGRDGRRARRPITIRQGVGSEILVRPQPDGMSRDRRPGGARRGRARTSAAQ